jgi:hypothetical protein
MTDLDTLHAKPDEVAELTSADSLAVGLAHIDAAREQTEALAQGREQDRQDSAALTPVWLRLITLLESAPPLPKSDADAVSLSKAVADDLRSAACPIRQIGSLSTKA